MTEKLGKGKISIKKSGKGYENFWLYIPSKIGKDSLFPFEDKEEVKIEIKNKQLIITKRDTLRELIKGYGIDNATLPYIIEEKANQNKHKPFLLFQDKSFSYLETHNISNRIANGILKILKVLKLKKKTHIALMLPNNPDFILIWFGIVKVGCLFVPINRFLRGDELKHVLEESDTSVLFIDFSFLSIFMEIQKDLPAIKKIIVLNKPEDYELTDILILYEDVISDNIENSKEKITPSRKMEIIFTEGTTGKPKAIVYRNMHILAGLILSELIKKYGEGDVVYCPTPLFQTFAQLVVVFPALFYNATIALTERFDAKTFWEDVKKFRADMIVYYGGILQILMDQPPSEKDRDHSVKYAVGGQAPKEIWEAFEKRFGVILYEGWAPTEAIGFTVNDVGTRGGKVGSIGTPIDGFEMKIVDRKGKELPPGPNNIGEIITRNTLNLSLEYYKTPDSTPMELKDSYIYTGDLGYKDKDGYFYYLGRKTDIIKRKGKQIQAYQIENVANSHPSILESAAFGVPSIDHGFEDIKICIVLKVYKEITHKEFHDYLSENLIGSLVPRYIEIKKQLRRSSERIKKYLLKEEWHDPKVKSNTWDSMLKDFLK